MTTETLTHAGSGSVSKLTIDVQSISCSVKELTLLVDPLVEELSRAYTSPDHLLICKRRRHAKPRTLPFQACVDCLACGGSSVARPRPNASLIAFDVSLCVVKLAFIEK